MTLRGRNRQKSLLVERLEVFERARRQPLQDYYAAGMTAPCNPHNALFCCCSPSAGLREAVPRDWQREGGPEERVEGSLAGQEEHQEEEPPRGDGTMRASPLLPAVEACVIEACVVLVVKAWAKALRRLLLRRMPPGCCLPLSSPCPSPSLLHPRALMCVAMQYPCVTVPLSSAFRRVACLDCATPLVVPQTQCAGSALPLAGRSLVACVAWLARFCFLRHAESAVPW